MKNKSSFILKTYVVPKLKTWVMIRISKITTDEIAHKIAQYERNRISFLFNFRGSAIGLFRGKTSEGKHKNHSRASHSENMVD